MGLCGQSHIIHLSTLPSTPKSSTTPIPVMLTRSKARALAADNTIIIVSPSATGRGTHIRWKYPARHDPYALPSSPLSRSGLEQSSPLSSLGASTESLSSNATLSDSSLSSLSDASSDVPFDELQIKALPDVQPPAALVTPNSPKKLQRTPLRRYVYGSTHLIQEAPPEEDESVARKLESVFQREWNNLMKSRELALQARQVDESGDESDEMESDVMDTDSECSRGDTEPPEAPRRVWVVRQPRLLGPHGTELIDHETFTPESSELPVYPQAWVSSRKSLRWQPTETFN